MNETNPPAIVKEAEQSINDLKKNICSTWPKFIRHGDDMTDEGRRMGAWLISLKARMPGSFRAWCVQNLPFTYRRVQQLMKLSDLGKSLANSISPEISLDRRLERNLKILSEDVDEKEVAPTGNVPFATNGNAPTAEKPAQEREPGDMTPAEEADDRRATELKAKIQAVLCEKCKRKGISCDRCRVKVFNLQNPKSGSESSAPKPPPKKPSTNGTPIFLWPDYHKSYGETARCVDKVCNGYGIPVVNPEAQELRNRLDDWDKDFKAWTARITKQKPPET